MKMTSTLMLAMWTLPISVICSGCADRESDSIPGYAEADYVRLSSPIAGMLDRLYVQRGDALKNKAPAFVLEQENESEARNQAAAQVQRAAATLANLKKGRRPDEIAAIQAQLNQAEAALRLSSANLARQKQLVAQKFISPSSLDEAVAAMRRDQGQVNEMQAQLRFARLGARPDEIRGAENDLEAAKAQLAQAEWKLEQKSVLAPADGDVVDVLFREGEQVPAGSPVVTLLPPQNIKARFFVPQARLGTLRLGQEISIGCDGCGAPIPARISYISPSAEYTSPLIYSRETRATLVFMIEARPGVQDARRLHPGQPLEIRLDEKERR